MEHQRNSNIIHRWSLLNKILKNWEETRKTGDTKKNQTRPDQQEYWQLSPKTE